MGLSQHLALLIEIAHVELCQRDKAIVVVEDYLIVAEGRQTYLAQLPHFPIDMRRA